MNLNNIRDWLLNNQLSLNVLKTEYMYLASGFNLANLDLKIAEAVKIGNQPLTRVHFTNPSDYLSEQRLVWEKQIGSLCNRISSALGALKQARRNVSPNTLQLTSVNNLQRPH